MKRAFVDLETTGFVPGQIAQLSYIITDEDLRVLTAKNFFFNVETMPKKASEVHGLTKAKLRKLSGDKAFFDSAREIRADLYKCAIISHNLAFDASFLHSEFRRLSMLPPKNLVGCTMEYFTDICRLPPFRNGRWKWPKLSEVMAQVSLKEQTILATARQLFQCEDIGFHDARYDVSAVYLICARAMSREQFCTMIGSIDEAAAIIAGPTVESQVAALLGAPRVETAETHPDGDMDAIIPMQPKQSAASSQGHRALMWIAVSALLSFVNPWIGALCFLVSMAYIGKAAEIPKKVDPLVAQGRACGICGAALGLFKSKVRNGTLCINCAGSCDFGFLTQINTKTLEDARAHLAIRKGNA